MILNGVTAVFVITPKAVCDFDARYLCSSWASCKNKWCVDWNISKIIKKTVTVKYTVGTV